MKRSRISLLFRQVKYDGLRTVRDRSFLFWSLLYPVLMASFFYLAFANLGKDSLDRIPVASAEKNDYYHILTQIDFLEVTVMDQESAIGAIKAGDQAGYVDEDSRLLIENNGLNQTLLKNILDEIKQSYGLMAELQSDSKIEVEVPDFSAIYTKHLVQTEQVSTIYFYALVGMVSLYGVFGTIDIMHKYQANLSAVGARVSTTPVFKSRLIGGGFLVSLLLNLACNIVLISYLTLVLRVKLFTVVLPTVTILLAANLVGTALGVVLGMLKHLSYTAKTMSAVAISLVLSFLSGMMTPSVKTAIAEALPLFHRLNPVAIVTDSLYRVNLLADFDYYPQGIIVLLVEATLLMALSIFSLRRQRYDSL